MTPLRLFDSHVHFWDPTRLTYPWLTEFGSLNRPCLPLDLASAQGQLECTGVVFVQADCVPEQARAEIEWITKLAESEPCIAGVVAFAPLEQGAALEPWLGELGAHPLVRGVRRLIQGESLRFAAEPAFVAGVKRLARHGLTMDLCLHAAQLPAVIELVTSCPEVSFVLDHLGKPAVAKGLREGHRQWAEDLAQLGQLDNLWAKLSGLVTEADHGRWKPADLDPYIETALEVFGPERLAFGSDWPVCTLAAEYSRWAQCVADSLGALSTAEQTAILCETGRRMYSI